MLSGQFIVSVLILLHFARCQVFQHTHTHTEKQSNSHKYEHEPKQNEHNRFFRYVSLCLCPTTNSNNNNNNNNRFLLSQSSWWVVRFYCCERRCRWLPQQTPVTCLWYVINTNRHTHTWICNCTSHCTQSHTQTRTQLLLFTRLQWKFNSIRCLCSCSVSN